MAMKTGEEYLQQQGQVAQTLQYQPSQNVLDANTHLQDVSAGKPAEYSSQQADQLGGLYSAIMNRGPYTYDPTKDQNYMDYRNSYQALGQAGAQAAQQNTQGLSGGYGNTWSGAVGSQQYQEGLKSMNDILPALEQNAFNAYQAEGSRLGTQLAATQAKEQMDYDKWKAEYSNWAADREFAQQRAQTEYSNDYSRYADNMNNVMTILGYERQDQQILRDNAYNWAMTLLQKGIMPLDEMLAAAGIDTALALKLAKKKGYKEPGSGGSGKGRGKGTGAASTTDTARTESGSHTIGSIVR